MDKYPETFSRESYIKVLHEKQEQLLSDTRRHVYDSVTECMNNLDESITITFNDKLWNKHRKTLVRELLDRFNHLSVVCSYHKGVPKCTKEISQSSTIPDRVLSVIIEFNIDNK